MPSSGPFVAADFTGSGVWLHPPEAAWRQLTPADAALMDMAGP